MSIGFNSEVSPTIPPGRKDRGTRNWFLSLPLAGMGEIYESDKPCGDYQLPHMLSGKSAIKYTIVCLLNVESSQPIGNWYYRCYLELVDTKTKTALAKYLGLPELKLEPRIVSKKDAILMCKPVAVGNAASQWWEGGNTVPKSQMNHPPSARSFDQQLSISTDTPLAEQGLRDTPLAEQGPQATSLAEQGPQAVRAPRVETSGALLLTSGQPVTGESSSDSVRANDLTREVRSSVRWQDQVPYVKPLVYWYWGIATDSMLVTAILHARPHCYVKEPGGTVTVDDRVVRLWPNYRQQRTVIINHFTAIDWTLDELLALAGLSSSSPVEVETGDGVLLFQVDSLFVLSLHHYSQLFRSDSDRERLALLVDQEAQFPVTCYCPKCMEYRIEQANGDKVSDGAIFDGQGRMISKPFQWISRFVMVSDDGILGYWGPLRES